MFDATTYDPYAGWSPFRETRQRINAARRQTQMPGLTNQPLVVDWTATDEVFKALDRSILGELSELDRNPLAQAVAGDLLRQAMQWLDNENSTDTADFEVALDTRWADEDAPFRALIRNGASKEVVWVPLSDPVKRWREVAVAHLDPRSPCDAHNHPDCNYYQDEPSWPDLAAYPIGRGDRMVIAFMCSICRERCNNRDWSVEDYPQTGALPWYPDTQKQEPDNLDNLW